MFFGRDRDHLVRELFVAAEEWRRRRADDSASNQPADPGREEAEGPFRAALAELKALQRRDFEGILREMDGRPVTVRLLDPPLHEFLSVEHYEREVATAEAAGAERGRSRNDEIGWRSCAAFGRQTRCSARAAPGSASSTRRCSRCGGGANRGRGRRSPSRQRAGDRDHAAADRLRAELAELRGSSTASPAATTTAAGVAVPYGRDDGRASARVPDRGSARPFVGCTSASAPTTSPRPDRPVQGRRRGSVSWLHDERGIVDRGPFETLDAPGVGELMRLRRRARLKTNPALKLGVCGEHGGDPASIRFFDRLGLDYGVARRRGFRRAARRRPGDVGRTGRRVTRGFRLGPSPPPARAISDSISNTAFAANSAVTWPGPSYAGATSTTSKPQSAAR